MSNVTKETIFSQIRITFRINRNSYNKPQQLIRISSDSPFQFIKDIIQRYPNCKILKVEKADPILQIYTDLELEE